MSRCRPLWIAGSLSVKLHIHAPHAMISVRFVAKHMLWISLRLRVDAFLAKFSPDKFAFCPKSGGVRVAGEYELRAPIDYVTFVIKFLLHPCYHGRTS